LEFGAETPGPHGTVIRYEGISEFRAVDTQPLLELVILVAGTVSANLISHWIVEKFGKRKAETLTINRHVVDLNDEGQVRRIVEQELRYERRD
jgi:hypothetical protein